MLTISNVITSLPWRASIVKILEPKNSFRSQVNPSSRISQITTPPHTIRTFKSNSNSTKKSFKVIAVKLRIFHGNSFILFSCLSITNFVASSLLCLSGFCRRKNNTSRIQIWTAKFLLLWNFRVLQSISDFSGWLKSVLVFGWVSLDGEKLNIPKRLKENKKLVWEIQLPPKNKLQMT